ncbi:hypothetical protein Scep_003620 [Stephania cephalantha]|uniref:Uncharacterized protein n=1 Tax=Stephania cephalantha TaxID=152367 RepID=A0AAP0PY83_9MAGN
MRSWGPTTPNLGLDLTPLRVRARSSTRPVSLSFSDLLRLRLASAASSLIRCFEPQFGMYEFYDLRYMEMMCISLWRISILKFVDGAQAQAQAQRKDSHSMVQFLGCFDLQFVF